MVALPSEMNLSGSPSGSPLVPATGHTPTGFFLPIPGAMLVEDCQPCPAGWFCSRAGLSSPEALCEGGWYCPQASVSGHSPGKDKLSETFPERKGWVVLEGDVGCGLLLNSTSLACRLMVTGQ